MTLLNISPEVRKAHLLTVFTPLLALLAWLPRQQWGLTAVHPRVRQAIAASVGLAALCTLLASEIIEEANYNDFFAYFGGFTGVMVALTAGAFASLWVYSNAPVEPCEATNGNARAN